MAFVVLQGNFSTRLERGVNSKMKVLVREIMWVKYFGIAMVYVYYFLAECQDIFFYL